MPGFSLNPIDYVLAAVCVLLAIVSGMYWYSSNELKVCNAEYQSFQNDTKLEGERSEHKRAETETSLATAATKIQGDLNAQYTINSKLHADYERMRRANKGDTRSGETSSLADTAGRFNCPDNGTELATALERLENGIQPILKSRDEAIIRTIACKAYVDEITDIANGKQPSQN